MTKKQIEKKAKEWCKQYIECDGNCRWCPNERYKDYFIEGAEWALSHQWVSVEDELPPQKERYSKYVIMRNRVGGHYIGCYDFVAELWLDGNLEMIYMDITHWMHIPPLAEEGGKK